MDYKPSKYQEKIYQFVLENPQKHLIIDAGPGAGKTTSLIGISKVIKEARPDSASIFLAFNVSIAKELGDRLQGFTSKTINSLFFSYYRAHMGFVKANSNKYWDIVRALLDAMSIYDETGDIAKSIEKWFGSLEPPCLI